MTDKATRDELARDAEAIAVEIATTPPELQTTLRTITKAMILGAQIAEQCQSIAGEAS